jgi:hypothetical protein
MRYRHQFINCVLNDDQIANREVGIVWGSTEVYDLKSVGYTASH